MTCSLSDLFFCKQKTAYEWRISDWSSDVCSSDLQIALRGLRERVAARPRGCAIGVERPGHHRVDADLRAVLLRERRRQHIEPHLGGGVRRETRIEIGRASCRERVCQYV